MCKEARETYDQFKQDSHRGIVLSDPQKATVGDF